MCNHTRLQPAVAFVERNDDGSITIDIWCESCGSSGSMVIDPTEVNFDDDPEQEQT